VSIEDENTNCYGEVSVTLEEGQKWQRLKGKLPGMTIKSVGKIISVKRIYVDEIEVKYSDPIANIAQNANIKAVVNFGVFCVLCLILSKAFVRFVSLCYQFSFSFFKYLLIITSDCDCSCYFPFLFLNIC
jgi:hypothetical protein